MTEGTPGGRHDRGSDDDGPDPEERTVRTPRAEPGSTPPTSASAETSSGGSAGEPEPTGSGERTSSPDATDDTTSGDAGDDPTLVEGSTRGRVRYQDPDTTTPREPTVAEQRARREAEKRREAQEAAAAAAEERKRKTRKRMLIGGGVAVGLVAVIAIGYAASSDEPETSAQCVDNQTKQVVPDEQCANGVQQGGYYEGGHFVPIFIPFGGFGGRQYHYNYGSSSPIGTVASGGSTAPPASGTSLRGSSGSTIGSTGAGGTVSRGGLGVGSGSKGGSSGSSGGSSGS